MTYTVARQRFGGYTFVTYEFSDGVVYYALENRARFQSVRYFARWA
jgi:hypothetical protein